MSESKLGETILNRLEPHFKIDREVPGTHFSGRQLRLDAVVQPRHNCEWKDPEVALGIEFKDTLRLKGSTTNFTGWLAQCVDYSHTHWDGFGYLSVFACPSLLDCLPGRDKPGDTRWILTRVMAHLGIGELFFYGKYGLTFLLQDKHRIWSESEQVASGRHWSLNRKFGTR